MSLNAGWKKQSKLNQCLWRSLSQADGRTQGNSAWLRNGLSHHQKSPFLSYWPRVLQQKCELARNIAWQLRQLVNSAIYSHLFWRGEEHTSSPAEMQFNVSVTPEVEGLIHPETVVLDKGNGSRGQVLRSLLGQDWHVDKGRA